MSLLSAIATSKVRAAAILTVETQLSPGNQILSAPGPDSTQFANSLGVAYSGGTATFDGPLGYVERRTQGTSWGGNFAPADPLFW